MPDPARIWIVEDTLDYREALCIVLDATDDLRAEHAFETVADLIAALDSDSSPPDLLLCDIHLPGVNGIDALPSLRERLDDVPIVLLTIADSEDLIFRAFRAGANGYLVKDASMNQILVAVREALRGGTLMPATVAQQVLGFFSNPESQQDELTGREKEVLFLMSEGYTKSAIADKLCISPHTADSHLRSVYSKLQVNSSTQAVARAVRQGLI